MVVKAKKAGRFSTDARYAGNRSVRQAFFLKKCGGKKKRPWPPEFCRRLCPSLASRRGNSPAQIEAGERASRRAQ